MYAYVYISCTDISNGQDTCPYARWSTSAPALSAVAADFAEVLVRVVAIEATNSDTSREYSWEVYIRSACCVGASATCAKARVTISRTVSKHITWV